MRSLGHEGIDAFVQGHWSDSVFAITNPVAILGLGNTVHQFEGALRPQSDIRNGGGAQPALGGGHDHTLIDLNVRQPGIQRIALRRRPLQIGLDRLNTARDHFIDFVRLESGLFFQLALRLLQLPGLVGVDPVILPFQVLDLLEERDIVRPKLIQFGFFHDAFSIEEERAVALHVKRFLPRRKVLFRLIFES